METELYFYSEAAGWQPQFDPSLDGDHSLILYFSDLSEEGLGNSLEALRRAYPEALLMGCSTAGQIHQDHFIESGASAVVIRFHRSRLQLNHVDIDDHENFQAVGEALNLMGNSEHVCL